MNLFDFVSLVECTHIISHTITLLSIHQGTHEMICNHVQTTYPGITERFHFFEKANVNGTNAREVYQFIKTQLGVDNVGWNFDLFVVTSTGEPYKYIPSSGAPFEKVKTVLDTLVGN